jgi:hypothetical protein
MPTTIQEAEDTQFFYETEESMAMQEASMVFNDESSEVRTGISAALAAGSFVVVEYANRYCRCTDAFVGSYPARFEVFASREAAVAGAQAMHDEYFDDEREIVVLPEVQRPAPVIDDGDDLPF